MHINMRAFKKGVDSVFNLRRFCQKVEYWLARHVYPDWLLRLVLRLQGRLTFKPCALECEDLGFTEILLKDCSTFWRPWGDRDEYRVDLGYDSKGNLIGMRVWDHVLKKPAQ